MMLEEKGRKSNEQQYMKMTTAPVGKLIARLAVPTMISMLVTAVYNMADTYFVSQLGTSAAGAVGIVFSLMIGDEEIAARIIGREIFEPVYSWGGVGTHFTDAHELLRETEALFHRVGVAVLQYIIGTEDQEQEREPADDEHKDK